MEFPWYQDFTKCKTRFLFNAFEQKPFQQNPP